MEFFFKTIDNRLIQEDFNSLLSILAPSFKNKILKRIFESNLRMNPVVINFSGIDYEENKDFNSEILMKGKSYAEVKVQRIKDRL